MAVEPTGIPFTEAIDFFKQKVNLPTRSWTDLWQGQHARAFVVAGGVKDDLISDLRNAVAKAIEQGTTLAEFRKDFDQAVAKHGWSYNGSRGWRTPELVQHRHYGQGYHGEPYASWGAEALKCMLARLKPAHTHIWYV
jgi:hypothetical protein